MSSSRAETGRSISERVRLRSVLRDPALARTGQTQLTVTLLLVIPVWMVLTAAALGLDSTNSQPSRASTVILSMFAAQLALGAAVLSGIRAWVRRDLTPALAAAGLCAYGFGSLVEAASRSISTTSPNRWFNSGCLALALGLLVLSVVGLRDKKRRGSQVFLWLYPVALAALLAGALSNQNLLLAAVWAVTGGGAIWIGRREHEPLKIWIGFTMLCLAQGSLAVDLLPTANLAQLGSHVLRVVATTLVLLGTLRALQETIGDHQAQVVEGLIAFQGSEARRRSEEHAHQEAVHNLRSALGAITLASHALVFSGESESLSDEERIHLARALESSLERARRLISQEWGSVRQTFSLLELCMPVIVRERRSGVVVDLDVAADAIVHGDRGRTIEVLEALLDNARHYAPTSPLTIRAVADDPWMTLVVADRGPGLPVDCLEKIFERGWTTAGEGEGAGIGLYVARTLMEEQGGSLRAANRAGGGAVFLARFRKAPLNFVTGLAPSLDAQIAATLFGDGDDDRLIGV